MESLRFSEMRVAQQAAVLLGAEGVEIDALARQIEADGVIAAWLASTSAAGLAASERAHVIAWAVEYRVPMLDAFDAIFVG